MSELTQLHIYEKILLLALRDKEGTMLPISNYHYALGGALLAELLLLGKINVIERRFSKLVELQDEKLLNDEILDTALGLIIKSKRRANIQTLISRFSNMRNLKHRAAGLCRKGILKEDEEQILFFFKRRVYPELNPLPEKELIGQMRTAILSGSDDIDPEIIIIISIAHATNLLKPILSKEEYKVSKKRIKQLINGEITGKATKEAIEAMQAAVMVACIMPAVMASTTSGS